MITRGVLALAARERLSILIFHRVLPEPDPLLPGEPSAEEFDALLAHVARRFTVLPLDEGIRRTFERTLPPRALAITFDDGYADNLSIAAPLLRARGIPATVFVATGYLDGGRMFNDLVIEAFRATRAPVLDLARLGLGVHRSGSIEERRIGIDRVLARLKYLPERDTRARELLHLAAVDVPPSHMLTSEGVRDLARNGIDVGAHTVTHPMLVSLSREDAWREICTGKCVLEQLLGRPVTLFAYPNGKPGHDYADEHVRMVCDAGFAAAVSTAWGAAGPASDPFQLPRFTPWTHTPWKFDLLMLRNLRGLLVASRSGQAGDTALATARAGDHAR